MAIGVVVASVGSNGNREIIRATPKLTLTLPDNQTFDYVVTPVPLNKGRFQVTPKPNL